MELDKTMQENLIKALTEIAEADEKIEDVEATFLSNVKMLIGM